MRAREFIKESAFDKDIKEILLSKGYKFLGAGQDQDAYLEPGTGMVLKIFGTGNNSASRYTESQQSFIDFANFCMANPNNRFLPYFDGWERFEYDGHYYLQIRVERMFDFWENAGPASTVLWSFSQAVYSGDYDNFDDWYGDASRNTLKSDAAHQLVMLIGSEEECELLWNTIMKLADLADRKGYIMDLHDGNFMLGADGEIIISDPFWSGSGRGTTSSLYNRSSTNTNSNAGTRDWSLD